MSSKTYGRMLMATLAWGVLAFGAVYPWGYWPLAASCLTLGVWGVAATRAWDDSRVRSLGWAAGAVIAAIGLQIVALPYWLIAQLSPSLDSFFRDYELGYHRAALHALSLAPESTLGVWVMALSFGVLLVALTRSIRLVPLEWLVTQVMGLGVGTALVGIVLRAFRDDKNPMVYGFWRPLEGGNPFGPFVNRNHFAGWMLMALPLVAMFAVSLLQQQQIARASRGAGTGGLAAWTSTVEGNRFLLVVFAALIMGTALVLTGSRSGVASFALVILVMAVFIIRRTQGRSAKLAAAAYLSFVLVGAIGWAGFGMVAARFGKASGELEGRFAAWRDTVRIVHDFPVFGIGLGSYRRAMLVYQTADRNAMYAQAHNDYLQLAAEGGLLVGIPVIILGGMIAVRIWRRLTSAEEDITTYWIRRGAVAGLVGIAAQSVVEFSLQMPGNAAWCVFLLAIALHRPRTPPSPDAHRL